MPDSIQFKRGPSSNVIRAAFKQAEPGFIYDTKEFCIGVAEDKAPVIFMNKEQIEDLLIETETRILSKVNNATFDLDYLMNHMHLAEKEIQKNTTEIETLKDLTATQYNNILEQLKRYAVKGEITSSDLSTAYDEDKIGLANLRQEVLTYIVLNGTSGPNERPLIPAGSITIDLLSKELAEIVSNDYGSY